ncbi:MAG: acetylornithine deacetylase [Saprospiraceae bacterium]
MSSREILAHLVSFPILGGQSNLPILEWIEDYLRNCGITELHRVPNADGTKACLHCRIGPARPGGIVLSGHMDVVPVAGQPWDTDPWTLTERNGNLYARGSCDMKGFLACCLAAVPRRLAADLKRPVYLAFSYDEEIGCMAGRAIAESIRDTYPEGPRFAIIGEPSMLQPIVGQKGINVYTTTVRGSQGHSSRVREEVIAVHEAARLIVWLEDYMERLIAAGRLDDRFHPPHTTLHAGKIGGGTAFNIIANQCSFDWDYRNIPRDDAAAIIADFQAHCTAREREVRTKFTGFAIENTALHPPVPALDTPAAAEVVDLITRLTGSSRLDTVAYASEAGQFAEAGFQAVICGPGSIAQAHRANEFVSIEQLAGCDAMLEKIG